MHARPGPHPHHQHDELFYVLNGEPTVRIGARTVTATAGSFVLIPRGTVHQPSNPTGQDVHILLVFSPGGMDTFFTVAAQGRHPLQKVSDDPEVQARLREFTGRYGYAFADLPSEA